MSIIKDLWYGRIDPQESGIYNTPEIKELMGYMNRHRSDLEKTLNEQEKELLEKYAECRSEQESILNMITFEYGFKLGASLIAEALFMDDETNNG